MRIPNHIPLLLILVDSCLKDDDSWTDWAGESCQYYCNDPYFPGECHGYDKFSHLENSSYPATNPCCCCRRGIIIPIITL